MKTKSGLTPELEKEMLGEDYFYEHGMNPALKNYAKMMGENTYGGAMMFERTPVLGRSPRFFNARDIWDFL